MKKIFLIILAIALITGAAVFANSMVAKRHGSCPNRPGCICTPRATEKAAKAKTGIGHQSDCPNMPGCICTE